MARIYNSNSGFTSCRLGFFSLQLRWKKRFAKRKHGISEIVATLIILAATLAIGVSLLSAATSSLSFGVVNQTNNVNLAAQQLQERLMVYDVWFHALPVGSAIEISLINYGTVYIDISYVYTNASGTLTPETNFTSTYPNGITVAPSDQARIVFPFPFVNGTNYEIELVSSSGSTFTSIWSA